MAYLLYVFICLLFILFHSTFFSTILSFGQYYDLLIPFVLYLGIFRAFSEGLPFVVILGFVMDSLSGGPFGLYMTTYFWLFVGVKYVLKYLQLRSYFLLSLAVTAGVLIENLVFLLSTAFSGQHWRPIADTAGLFVAQTVWALITGAFFILMIKFIHKRWNMLLLKYLGELTDRSAGE